MCGIGGIVRIGKRPIRKWQLQQMAIDLQHRGTDATGFAVMETDGLIHVYKVAAPAWKAVAEKAFHDWADRVLTDRARILLVHTRAFTKGSPHNNENNHPLFAEPQKGQPIQGVVIHNGMVRNDDTLFEVNKKIGFKRSCVTDSDIFRALLDNHGRVDKELIKEMRLVDGTASVAAFHSASPGKLLLLRDSNPLILGATSDTMAFASTKEALHKVLKPWVKVHNLAMQVHAPDLSFIPMRNETGYIVGPNGVEEHDEFKCNGRGFGGYTKYSKNTSYWEKQTRAAREASLERTALAVKVNSTQVAHAKVTAFSVISGEGDEDGGEVLGTPVNYMTPSLFEYTICPKCDKHVELSEHDRKLASISQLACKSCGTNLAGAPDANLAVN